MPLQNNLILLIIFLNVTLKMKRKENKKNYKEVDNFERKGNKITSKKDKSSKRRLSIYDDFEDEEFDDDYQLGYEEEE